jgi:hypothetical protein
MSSELAAEKPTKVYKRVQAQEKKKGLTKKLLIIFGAIVAAIVIAGIILGCIPVSAFSDFTDYDYANITAPDGISHAVDRIVADTDATHDQYEVSKLLNAGLKKTRYSILRGLLEGTASSGYKFQRDADKEKVLLAAADAKAKFARPEEGKYAIQFVYKSVKSVKVEGETVEFDTAVVILSANSGNIIETYTFYLYVDSKVGNANDESRGYEVTPITVKAKALTLYNNVTGIFDYFK